MKNPPPTSLVLAGVALFAVALLAGSLTLSWNLPPGENCSRAYANLFAGGVLLGVSTLHMLPDALESLHTTQALIYYLLGVAFVSLTDKLCSHAFPPAFDMGVETPQDPTSLEADRKRTAQVDIDLESVVTVTERTSLLYANSLDKERSFEALTDDSSILCPSCEEEHTSDDVPGDGPRINAVAANNRNTTSLASALSLWLALALHSLLEGASLGAQPYRLDLALGLFMHKGLVAMPVALSWRQYPLLLFSFCVMTPIGMALGWIFVGRHSMASNGTGSNVAGSIVAALAGGTFLYVGLHEMLIPAWRVCCSRGSHWLSTGGTTALGVALVAIWSG